MKILLTRPFHHSLNTHTLLEEMGHEVIWEPMMTILPTNVKCPKEEWDGVIVTSVHAVSALAENVEDKNICIVAIGEATAKELKAVGFRNVSSANGDAHDMVKKVGEMFKHGDKVLYPCAQETAHNITEMLEEVGIQGSKWVVYKAEEITRFSEEVENKLKNGEIEAVMLTSGRITQCFVNLFQKLRNNLKVEKSGENSREIPLFFALSDAIKDKLPDDWKHKCKVAREPNQDALIKLI